MQALYAWLLTFVLILAVASTSLAKTVVITAEHVRVLVGPGTMHPIIGKIRKGGKYEFLEESSGWWKLRLDDGTRGWILGKLGRIAEESKRGLTAGRKEKARSDSSVYQKNWAVVIGINAYRTWPRLNYAVNDAQAMAGILGELGFSEIIRLMDEDATKVGIERTLNSLKGRVKPEDQVLIFYAGHGATETLADGSKMGYWIPVDGDKKNYIATAISMDTIRLFSQVIPARHVLYAIDACYSGLALRQVWMTETERLTRQIITAGRAGEQVKEERGHGMFTRQLLKALEGAADIDNDSAITASELGVFLQSVLPNMSKGSQHPIFGRWAGEGEFVIPVRKGVARQSPSEPAVISPLAMRPLLPVGPRIMIVIPEVLDNSRVPNPSGEAEVIRGFIDAGYQVVDQGQIDEIRNPREVHSILITGNTAPAKAIGRQYGADLIIIGEGVGERVGNIIAGSRLVSSRARIQVKVVNTKSGQIVASHAVTAGGVDLAPTIAGKKALAKAGSQLAKALIARIKD